jgi:hypothetical protein
LRQGVRGDAGHDADAYNELPRETCAEENLQKTLVFESYCGLVRFGSHVAQEQKEKKAKD